jgi:hypothetical protein
MQGTGLSSPGFVRLSIHFLAGQLINKCTFPWFRGKYRLSEGGGSDAGVLGVNAVLFHLMLNVPCCT